MAKTKEEKAADRRIDQVYNANCKNIQINMLDIPKIFKVGREAIAAGDDDDALTKKIVEFVETIRLN